MINLLPPKQKRQIRASRANSILIRYTIVSLLVIGVLLAEILYVNISLDNIESAAKKQIEDNNQKIEDFEATNNAIKDFQNNLSVAKKILDNQINYSGVLLKVGAIIPEETVLTSLSLDQSVAGKEVSIKGSAVSYEKAIELRNSLENSPLFTSVRFSSISRNKPTETSDADNYPYKITFNVIFKKEEIK